MQPTSSSIDFAGALSASTSNIPILFENRCVIVVDKPAGWLSVPSRIGDADERPCVGRVLQATQRQQLWPTHRLDQEVTGLLIFAKDAASHRVLNDAFANKTIHKTYRARSQGVTPGDAQLGRTVQWECKLLRGKKRAYLHGAGKLSATRATLLHVAPDVLEWELQPLTGRPHQLRVELSRRGCPIIGDVLYGARPAASFEPGIALRAVQIELTSELAAALEMPAMLRAPKTWT